MSKKQPDEKKKQRKTLNAIKEFFTLPQLKQADDSDLYLGPKLEQYSTQRQQMAQYSSRRVSRHSTPEVIATDDENERINRDRLELAKLSKAHEQMKQSGDALNLTLVSQHRLLIATLITALVALIVGIISLVNKPVVNVQPPSVNVQPPTVNVQPPDIHINVTPE